MDHPLERVAARLRHQIGADAYDSWFPRVQVDGIEGDCIRLSVPTRFLKSWITQHYIEQLTALWAAEIPGARVEIAVRSASPVPAPIPPTPAVPTQPRAPQPSVPDFTSPLDPLFTAERFIMGDANRLAFAAAIRVADARMGGVSFNPLYIHGPTGVGKTHLLQALAQRAMKDQTRVVYLSAERFTCAFAQASKNRSAWQLRDRLREVDLLLIDDVHRLQTRAMAAEFAHTVTHLVNEGRQLVFAADRQPAELEGCEGRVKSRLASGLVLDIAYCDEALAIEIVGARAREIGAANAGFALDREGIALVAKLCGRTGRDVGSAMNRLLATATLGRKMLTPAVIEAALADMARRNEPKRVRVDDVLRAVSRHYGVSRADILSHRRTAIVVKPRQVAMYLAKTLTLRSLPEIGRRFGGRDHTTVLHAVRKIEGLVGSDQVLAAEVDVLKQMAGAAQ